MASRKFHLSEEQAQELVLAFQTCKNGPTRTRFQGVRLYGQGYPLAQILDICTCDPRTLLRWVAHYQQGGIAALTDQRKGGNRALLRAQQIDYLAQQLHRYTPAQRLGKDQASGPGDGAFWSIRDLALLVEQEFGVVYRTRASYQELMARCGMSYQRSAKQYQSHSPAKRIAFEEALEKKAGGRGSGSSRDGDPGGR